MPRPALPFLITASFFTVLLVGACGTDGPRGAADDDRPARLGTEAERLLAAAPEATVASGSARTATLITLSGIPEHADVLEMAGSGSIDFGAGRSASTLELSALFPDGDVPTDVRHLDTVLDGGLLYVRSPLLTSLAGITTPWMRLDRATAPVDGMGAALGQLGQLPGGDITAPLALLAGVRDGSVHHVGAEEVRGEPTTHLAANVDLRAAVERAGILTDADRFEDFAAGLGATVLDVEAFVDGSGRLRRLSYEHPLPGGGAQRLEIEYFDFGAPVEVALPPEDEITDLAEGPAR